MDTILLLAFFIFCVWWMLTALKGEKKRNDATIAREKKQMDMYERIIRELDRTNGVL